jgi:hypothetical protein
VHSIVVSRDLDFNIVARYIVKGLGDGVSPAPNRTRKTDMKDPNLVSAFYDKVGEPGEPASDTDRVWFERHPERVHRLRSLVPFESMQPLGLPPLEMTWRILVTRVAAGGRLRLPVPLPRNVSNEDADDQRLALIFDHIAPPDLRKIRAITMKERRQR